MSRVEFSDLIIPWVGEMQQVRVVYDGYRFLARVASLRRPVFGAFGGQTEGRVRVKVERIIDSPDSTDRPIFVGDAFWVDHRHIEAITSE